jgi:hypothetical protein
LNNQFTLATSPAVVIVVSFTIWIIVEVTVNKSGALAAIERIVGTIRNV